MRSDLNRFFKSISIMQKNKKEKKIVFQFVLTILLHRLIQVFFGSKSLSIFLQEFLLDFYQPAGLCRETAITEKITKFRHI